MTAVKRSQVILLTIGMVMVLLGTGACSSGGSHRTVRESERVYRTSDEVCRETTVTERGRSDDGRRAAGTVAGAIVGGVIGHQIGDGRGNDAATVGGAAAGAYAGNQLAKDRDRTATRRTETRVVCRDR